MKFMHHNSDDDDEDAYWWNRIPYEIECKGEIECYDEVNERYPKYSTIIYNYAQKYKKRLKNIAVSTTKVKSVKRKNINIFLIGILFTCLFISLA